ncbi:uncharacterized protein TNCV_552581 [Trichonephila clavipes]|nr:uncharacterized protein TNCV_552581 [Trichonephila clavipes]
MIVQFRNIKVSNHRSIPITIDCNVVAFIVFEEGFHQPIKRTKQSIFLDVTVFRHTHLWISFTPNAAVLFVDVAIQPEVRFIAKQKFAYENREQRQSRFGHIRRTYALLVEPPSLEEVIEAINKLNDHKAPGPKAILSELLKNGRKETSKKVYDLIQESWEQEAIPKEWKMSITCVVHKKGVENTAGDYQNGFRKARSFTEQIFNIRQENRTWRRSNLELYHPYKESNIVNFIKIQRIKWAGHVIRMNEDHTTKKVFNIQPIGTRRKGRPNLRWIDDLEKDLLVLKTRNWENTGRKKAGLKKTS